jgi:hypothetical protein
MSSRKMLKIVVFIKISLFFGLIWIAKKPAEGGLFVIIAKVVQPSTL